MKRALNFVFHLLAGYPALVSLSFCVVCLTASFGLAQSKPAFQFPPQVSMAVEMIKEERYNDAINKLEQYLDSKPDDTEALTMLATARVYKENDYAKGLRHFEEAMKKGGGASFFVNHSHEVTKMGTGDPVNYCRGWLHLRKGWMTFIPDSSTHSLSLSAKEIIEIEQNRFPNKNLFHIKAGKEINYNFTPRSHQQSEILLILVMFEKLLQK